MAKMKKKAKGSTGFVLFDVIYDDGSRSSNRRVPAAELEGPDGDDAARYVIEAQDRELAERSGRLRGTVKTITRSSTR